MSLYGEGKCICVCVMRVALWGCEVMVFVVFVDFVVVVVVVVVVVLPLASSPLVSTESTFITFIRWPLCLFGVFLGCCLCLSVMNAKV